MNHALPSGILGLFSLPSNMGETLPRHGGPFFPVGSPFFSLDMFLFLLVLLDGRVFGAVGAFPMAEVVLSFSRKQHL